MTGTIGFLVNPVAGMGGTVGLKGTDGQAEEAVRRGAVPRAAARAGETLDLLMGSGIRFLTCSGAMGQAALEAAKITSYEVVYASGEPSSGKDTMKACRTFIEHGVDLILFCGGDGTARDVLDVVDRTVPILGIPAGVKMYSAVFAVDPGAAAAILHRIKAGAVSLRDAEVLDVDEEAYRRGSLAARFYGTARTPYLPEQVQGAKAVVEEADDGRAKEEIARFIKEVMVPDTLYIIGAGSTTQAVLEHLGIESSLLGVDLVKNGRLVGKDADEATILANLSGAGRAKIIVSPIGAQGFVLGRGNQQISPAVLRRVGIENLVVIGTPAKLSATPRLYVDTGDALLDRSFGDSLPVVSGYRIAQRKRLLHRQ
jgi:predicted polyphosphate/ATP-dependent NAD kinase